MVALCSCGKESKYCCPGCQRRTCSVECVKKHKVDFSCSGISNKTEYAKLSDFDNMKLISDYKFLENIKDAIDSSQRRNLQDGLYSNTSGMIKKQCITNNTLLKLMPAAFSRHKSNNSYFKDASIQWTVELIFSDRSTKIIANHVSEKSNIVDIIERYKTISVDYAEYKLVSTYYKDDPKVSYFIQADVGEATTFHKLDPEASLTESLKFKTVIEYPTIYITSKPAQFRTVDCVAYDVKDEMKKLGILWEGKRKRNNRKRSWKRQRKNENRDTKNDLPSNQKEGKEESETSTVTSKNEANPVVNKNCFKNNVLKLFGDEESASFRPEKESTNSFKQQILASFVAEEEGEISS